MSRSGLWLHAIELFLVGGLVAVHRLARRRGERMGLVPAVSVAAPLLVALFLTSISWRIFYNATFPILQYADTRCFELGSRADELLVSCPSLPPPRNLTVSRGTPSFGARAPRGICSTTSQTRCSRADRHGSDGGCGGCHSKERGRDRCDC